ncbi:hypothetical protein SK128_005810 [Halocaridina rubra]|uniref:Uncharacterized protein n=1 Tax=Halocaridina rubra TaxID=373956 RepID=A0AAN8XK72_HALRR
MRSMVLLSLYGNEDHKSSISRLHSLPLVPSSATVPVQQSPLSPPGIVPSRYPPPPPEQKPTLKTTLMAGAVRENVLAFREKRDLQNCDYLKR